MHTTGEVSEMMDIAKGKQEQSGVRKIKCKRHATTSSVTSAAKKYRTNEKFF
jgi:hypothetical protein